MKDNENTPKTRVHTSLYNLIFSNPGITRGQVLANHNLQEACLSKAQRARLESGDEITLKRWNRKINRYLRQIRRDGHDIIVKRAEGVTNYTAAQSIPDYTEVLEPAVQVPFPKVDPQRELEESNQLMSFDQLMADLDSDVLGQTEEMKANNLLF